MRKANRSAAPEGSCLAFLCDCEFGRISRLQAGSEDTVSAGGEAAPHNRERRFGGARPWVSGAYSGGPVSS